MIGPWHHLCAVGPSERRAGSAEGPGHTCQMTEEKTMSRISLLVMIGLALATLGCESSVAGPGAGNETATIVGSVESGHQVAGFHAGSSGTALSNDAAAEASSVAAVAVGGGGSLEVLAEAEVQSDGRFSIEDVPAGQAGLFISARASGGEEVGRVLVQEETQAGATVVTEPINGETTVEGLVYEVLTGAGAPEEVRNTALLALFLRLEESSAAEVAASAQTIQEVADGYRAGAAAMIQAVAQLDGDIDAAVWGQALAEAAQEHARDRDEGAASAAAQAEFREAALEAFAQAGAAPADVSLATAAAATGLDRAGGVSNEHARVDIARNAVELNLEARSDVVASVPASQRPDGAASAFASAQAQASTAASVDELTEALQTLAADLEEEIVAAVMAAISNAPEHVQVIVEERLETALAQADLNARLEGAADAGALVQAVMEYREQVRDAVESFLDALPQSVPMGAEATADLLIAVRGGPALDQGS